MMLTLNQANWEELRQQAPQPCRLDVVLDDDEKLIGVPELLGRGYCRHLELYPGIWLSLSNWGLHQNWSLHVPVHEHLVQSLVMLSGTLPHGDVYPTLGDGRSYLSGSGISPAYTACYERSQRLTMVNIHLLPEVLERFCAGQAETELLKLLIKQNDWKVSFFPSVTAAMQRVAQQMWTAPYCGPTRRLYLQAKALELLALQLQPILADQTLLQPPPGRKPDTIARVYHARELLASQLDNPPALLELAQQVGVSDRTLRRGFQDVFGTSVIGYLTQQRMEQAEQLLREGNYTVAEVANRVGYAHLGHFAAGFKRQFGITPRQAMVGQRSG
jgi:AraC-like DNA-binding protein